VISLTELAERRQGLMEQRRLAEQQLEQHRRLREQQVHIRDVLESLSAFSERVGARLQSASIADRQALLQLVVERITVHDDHLEIQHVIPLRDPTPGPGTPPPAKPRLRSDGVRPARGQGDNLPVRQRLERRPGASGIEAWRVKTPQAA